MLNNEVITARIRAMGKRAGLNSDRQICIRCGFNDATPIGKISKLKKSLQLDTIQRFAVGLGCAIEDLIYDRSEADVVLGQLIPKLSEFEKAKVVGIIEQMIFEKNSEQKKAA